MAGRARSVSAYRHESLAHGWQMRHVSPGSVTGPTEIDAAPGSWLALEGPSTVAAALRAAGGWSSAGPTRRLDADDWWFRCRFPFKAQPDDQSIVLGLDGVATIADVWLNGEALLSIENMFHRHETPIDRIVQSHNELVMRCRALDPLLAVRGPRPRWRAPQVEHQQLRWFRTTLLGRTPGWSPPLPAIGPWRDVWLERRRRVLIDDPRIHCEVVAGRGLVHIACTVSATGPSAVADVVASVARPGAEYSVRLHPEGGTARYSGTVEVADPDLWWPHTHGEPALYRARLHITDRNTSTPATDVDLGSIGFRSLHLERADGDFALHVNGVRVFCRGACWTPLDVIGLSSGEAAYRAALDQVRTAGMNMLRVSGTTVYETDTFLDLCDASGVLVWQDFMFANMDYPEQDDRFKASVILEAEQQLARLQGHPSLGVLCGNSEASQQAAMWGAAREAWRPSLFTETFARLASAFGPGVPYCPSSTDGGAFPHQVNSGVTSYFGVGAYLRPLEDARRSELRFASECLAFANIPDEPAIARMPGGLSIRVHHAAWKSGTPHDLGAGWDFEDVRDHYLAALFRVNPLEVRYADHDRYLALGRVASGEVMAAAFGEWRRARSTCRGALIWFLRDLVPGAGWGIVDAFGAPKAAYYYVRRVLQPCGIFVTDEGCNGLVIHVANDSPRRIEARIDLDLFKSGEIAVGTASTDTVLEPHSTGEIAAAGLFPDFQDLSYAFRFGPPALDLAVATLSSSHGGVLGRAFHFPAGLPATREREIGLTAVVETQEPSRYVLKLSTRRFAQSVSIDVDGFRADDQYFHMAPQSRREIVLEASGPNRPGAPRGTIRALNCETTTRISLTP